MDDWQPTIVAFMCNWCSYVGADKAGGKKLAYAAGVMPVRVMCSGRVDPQLVLAALRRGADGVLVLGCHPGDCHYRSGNLKAMRRFRLLERLVQQLGVDARRLRIDWVGAGEGERFAQIANEMSAAVAELGPLSLPGHVRSEVA